MDIAILLFDRITALDAIGPYEVLARLPDVRVRFAAPARGEVRTDNRCLGLVADLALEDVTRCDLLVVPGGFGARLLERDGRVLDWIRAIDRGTAITASVCSGSLLLAAAGLLRGRRANSNWTVRERLAEYGAIPVPDRVVRDGKYATAAGVSAGIDLALALALEIAGRDVAEAIQLSLEYDPAPPLDAGDPARAPEAAREAVLARARGRTRDLVTSQEEKR